MNVLLLLYEIMTDNANAREVSITHTVKDNYSTNRASLPRRRNGLTVFQNINGSFSKEIHFFYIKIAIKKLRLYLAVLSFHTYFIL